MKKYAPIAPIAIEQRTWPECQITTSPVWCAVDLRDGNQALPNPLTMEQKKVYFDMLLKIGFKEIEVGFPAASKEDYDFCRFLIENGRIPRDVLISVLAPSRPDLITKTVQCLAGAPRATVHIYIATSDLHREHVLGKSRAELKEMVRESIAAIRAEAALHPQTRYFLEFSPEEFTDTDLDFAVEICDFVIDEWQPAADEKVILNLPATVERRPPQHYADMIELFRRRLRNLPKAVISLHAHNDMGCAVASTTLALQAGGERVEGTLFGHGERSGNVDLITLVLNLQYMGIDTGLDFSSLAEINELVSGLTGMSPHARHPYVGELVFSAFSGSHQDAIHKCMAKKEQMMQTFGRWKIPYLHIDPSDVGRKFEKLIRINSQSGKGGIAHILQAEHGIKLPRHFQTDFAARVQLYTEKVAREVSAHEIWQVYNDAYVNVAPAPLELINYWPYPDEKFPEIIHAKVEISYNGQTHRLEARDNGPIAAFCAALRKLPTGLPFTLSSYEEGAVGGSDRADAISYVVLQSGTRQALGIGQHSNIDQAAVRAIVAALNNLAKG